MSRLQKKCLIVSMGFHVLLGVSLLVGAAFAGRHKEDDDVPPMMTLIPSRLVDALASGGGNPSVTTPPAPAPQVSQPIAAEIPKPEVKPEPKAVEPAPTPEPQKIEPPKLERKAEPKVEPKPKKKSREPEPNYEELISNLKDIDQTTPRG
jgi:outer membrane biosynthesis protein TonB